MDIATWEDFEKIELRVGTVIEAWLHPTAKIPAYVLKIDLGQNIGIRTSSARLTDNYTPDTLHGRQVICVCNFEPRQIGSVKSEVLTLGLAGPSGVVLIGPDQAVANGQPLY